MLYQYIYENPYDELISDTEQKNLYLMYDVLFCSNNIELIKKMIYSSSEISDDDKCILIKAIYMNNYEIIGILLAKSINLNEEFIFKDYNYILPFPLEVAIEKRNKDMCDFLIQNGCDVNNSKILIKCISTDCDFIKYFFSYLPDVNVIVPYIYDCKQYIYIDILVVLIDLGLNVSNIDMNKNCMFTLFDNFTIDQIKFLVDHDIKLVNHMLYNALINFNVELIEYLLQCGLVFDKDVTYEIFYSDNFNRMQHIKLLLNYECDLSYIRENVAIGCCTKIKNNGYDPEFILDALLDG